MICLPANEQTASNRFETRSISKTSAGWRGFCRQSVPGIHAIRSSETLFADPQRIETLLIDGVVELQGELLRLEELTTGEWFVLSRFVERFVIHWHDRALTEAYPAFLVEAVRRNKTVERVPQSVGH